jgi:hypothetical protein
MMLAIQCLFAAFYAAREQETARRASQESISRLARRAARLRP